MANKPIPLNLNIPFENFDINEGVDDNTPNVSRLPSLTDMPLISTNDYASYWTHMGKSRVGGLLALAKDFASSLPPSTQTFSRVSYMPNATSSQMGVLQWPGLPPETLQKLAREMLGPQMIIGLRSDDILRYATISSQPWRPGWQIKPLDSNEKITNELRKEIREAEQFILNSGYGEEFMDPLQRDAELRCSFSKFLLEILRDSLVYDGIAIWTDRDTRGRIRSYAPLPAGHIRLLARPDKAKIKEVHEGELNFYGETSLTGKHPEINPNNPPFAVAVDETNNIVQTFTREDLIWYTRNPRVDAEIGGYGYPELEIAITLVTGFNNAIQFNADIFDKNSIPKGILAIKGNFTQRQFDALGRIWDNLQRGARNSWTLPAIQLSEKGEIEVINLEPLRKEPAYYSNLINLFMGALSTVYRIPVHRLGYKISGTERDSRPDTPKSLADDDDIGLPALLGHIEILLNTYFVSNRWPHLRFTFTGKSTKEDARLYEAHMLAMTVDGRRRLIGLPSYEEDLPRGADEDMVKAARWMGMAPVDPAGIAVYQSLIAAFTKGGAFGIVPTAGEGGEGKTDIPGPRMTPKKDPAESEKHGHMSGVRRNSKMEDSSQKKPPNLRRNLQTHSTVDKT